MTEAELAAIAAWALLAQDYMLWEPSQAADFIDRARFELPKLIAEVRKLRRELAFSMQITETALAGLREASTQLDDMIGEDC